MNGRQIKVASGTSTTVWPVVVLIGPCKHGLHRLALFDGTTVYFPAEHEDGYHMVMDTVRRVVLQGERAVAVHVLRKFGLIDWQFYASEVEPYVGDL